MTLSSHFFRISKQITYATEPVFGRARQVLSGSARRALHDKAPHLGEVVDEALSSHRTAEENALFRRIEGLRQRALRSNEVIEQLDFGAGRPDETLSAEAMASGRKQTRKVASMVQASKSPFWAGFLFRLVRNLKRQNGIELGTCLGLSAAYQAGAMKLNGKGKLHTFEGAPALADIAARHLDELGLNAHVDIVRGRFADTLPVQLERLAPLDYVFIDGHHDEHATIAYFEQMYPYLASDAIVVFDDIAWSPGMARAWQTLRADARLPVAIDLGRIGVTQVGDRAPIKVDLRVR
jgi:predicted O-methyltransferase YrrM